MIILTNLKYSEDEIQDMGKDIELYHIGKDLSMIPKDIIEKTEILFAHSGVLKKDSLYMFKSLKWIQLTTDGYDSVDLEYIFSKGIKISNANGVFGITIAEDVFAKMLLFTRQSKFFLENMKENRWDVNIELNELYDKNMVILGTGDIGREVAKRAKAFGMNINGFNRSSICPDVFDYVTNDMIKLKQMLNDCDYFVVAIPLTKKSYHFVDETVLSWLNKNSYIINVARGKIIDETALIRSLKNNEIKGAMLDVFETEPLDPTSELWSLENAFLTPHISGTGGREYERLKKLFLSNLKHYPQYTDMKYMISLEDV